MSIITKRGTTENQSNILQTLDNGNRYTDAEKLAKKIVYAVLF